MQSVPGLLASIVASFSDCQLSISISGSNIPPVGARKSQRKPQKGTHIENVSPRSCRKSVYVSSQAIALSKAKKGRHPSNASE